jgi:hypothetical protein
LRERGIAWIAADASREREQRVVAEARTVPRYPMNLFFNTGRTQELIDEFNWIHSAAADGGSGSCSQNPSATCLTPLDLEHGFSDWIVPREARTLELHALSNDPRPHYAHQSNVAEDRLLYPVIERLLSEYRSVFGPNAPLISLTLAQAGAELRDQQAWEANQSSVSAYVEAGVLRLTSTADLDVPLTVPAESQLDGEAEVLPSYAGARTGWLSVGSMFGPVVQLPASVGYAR